MNRICFLIAPQRIFQILKANIIYPFLKRHGSKLVQTESIRQIQRILLVDEIIVIGEILKHSIKLLLLLLNVAFMINIRNKIFYA